MNRSIEASMLRDTNSCRDYHRSHLPDLSTTSLSQRGGGGEVEDTVLLEILIPVYSKLEDREEVCRSLGVFVNTGRGGINGLSRKVSLRLTDPADPFFLFELELLEDDYGAFKQRLELLVDFSGFPKYLVSMLNGVVAGVMPYVVCFVVDSRDATRGTLRVLERTDFRTVEHISLVLMRQGDAGQKKYLAERFQYFEKAYTKAKEEYRVESAAAAANIEALKSEVASMEESRAKLREQLTLEVAKSEKNQLVSVSQMREEHASQVSQLRTSFESELRHVTRKAEEVQKQLLDDVREKDKGLQEARQRISSLESSLITLQSQLRTAGDKCTAQAKELEELRSSNNELLDFRSQATRSLSDNELNYVKLQERLRGLVQTLKSRDEELRSLREQYHNQDNYIHILTTQNDQLTEQNKKSELSLTKAHHIISNQLKYIKGVKDRERIMKNQLHSQDSLLQEKVNSINRLRDELASSTERAQILQNKATELREQLEKTDSAREKLAQELKQSQDALIHLQRCTSVNGRHWSILGSTNNNTSNGFSMGLSSSSGSVSYDAYKELNKNANITLRSNGLTPSYGINDISVMPQNANINTNSVSDGGVNNIQRENTREFNNANKQSQVPIHSSNKNEINNNESNTINSTGNNVTKTLNTGEIRIINGKNGRQPLDTTAINMASIQKNQGFASKNFFNDGGNKTDLTMNTGSFVGKIPAATAAAAPSAYF